MTVRFPVPEAYRAQGWSSEREAWCDRLPDQAETLAEQWGLAPDGEPGYGFLSVVWPVRNATGRALVLKIHDFTAGTVGERLALEAVRVPALVELVASEPAMNALLLQRLDPFRTLLELSADHACEVIGDIVAAISSCAAPDGMRSVAEVSDSIRASIRAMLDRTPDVLPRRLADRALETLNALGAEGCSTNRGLTVIHGDLHYENVLHTLPDDPPRWVAIDPLPAAGQPEWEVAPCIRNRWADAEATGDPERALRRRFDIVCERASLDRELARRILQAIAVDNVLWLSTTEVTIPMVRSFMSPYRLAARW